MLPVALTCPLWWVARWASRLLAGLALTAGLTVGVAPAHAAGPALVPAHAAGPAAGPALRVLPNLVGADCGALPGQGTPDAAAPDPRADTVSVGVVTDAAPAHRGAVVAASTTRTAVDAVGSAVAVPPGAGVRHGSAGRPLAGPGDSPVAGQLPATAGSRAPPLD
ncbi:hypothetical protein QTQ03_01275 [Micromonospora sp. WMMA1363]|uniref:hypothetical protein n=1 Tax=Micromonospora sp. WMMA1363 TaxID=3053985 RepID=UPI00259D07E1|nr:hypothetical protein [Micromonospora sp. WMMA1363]MDM4718281.1 hypothetical protein [Micromonospora sp. WMMA1363]